MCVCARVLCSFTGSEIDTSVRSIRYAYRSQYSVSVFECDYFSVVDIDLVVFCNDGLTIHHHELCEMRS